MEENPEKMLNFSLLAYCNKLGHNLPKTATRDEMLLALGLKKKGKRTWKPAKVLDVNIPREVRGKIRPRWRDKDSQNIQRALAEGWQFFDPSKGLRAEHDHSSTGVPEYRELVLMALPEEDGLARDEYFEERTNQQTLGVKKRLQKELDDSAEKEGGYRTSVEGQIVID